MSGTLTTMFRAFAVLGMTVFGVAGVPEPDVVFYGHVTRSPLNTAYVPASVTWSLSGNAETVSMSQTTVVSVNGETFLPHPHPLRDAPTGRPHPAPRERKPFRVRDAESRWS